MVTLMDQQQRQQILAEARRTVETIDRAREEWERERAAREAAPLFYEPPRSRMRSRYVAKSEPNDGLIFKVHENEQAATPAADGTDPWRDWNVWADARIAASLDGLADAFGEAIAVERNELIDIIREGLRKRDQRIAALEGKVDVLLGLLQVKGGADIVALPGRKQHG
jgi:hypothetical protein